MAAVCKAVADRARNQLLAEGFAVIAKPSEGPAYRARIAETYQAFAGQLRALASQADGELGKALLDWASASTEVAQFVIDHKPRPGIVVEYGPGQDRAEAAETAAEALCGHPLPY